jgi:hypothetical protein
MDITDFGFSPLAFVSFMYNILRSSCDTSTYA